MKLFVTFFRKRRRRVVRRRRIVSAKSRADYLEHKEKARTLISERLAYFNVHYGFKVGDIRIKNQKTRWGSCSSKGNISFNYRLAHLPPHLSDYVVVHELCHLGELNHSQNFWDLVGQTIPDYAERRTELRKIHLH